MSIKYLAKCPVESNNRNDNDKLIKPPGGIHIHSGSTGQWLRT